jgi:uncharacterized protein (DUF2252 family)
LINQRRWITAVFLGVIALSAAGAPAERPLDVLQRTYGEHLTRNDPLAMPMKLRSLVADEYGLWRGGKDLFFHWCQAHCDRWLKDTDATMTLHGDQHLGNIGTYLIDPRTGELAFGMVDFDDSHRMPFMFELLQGVVTVRLTARENGIELGGEDLKRLVDRMLGDYRAAALSDQTTTKLLQNDPLVAKLLAGPPRRDFAKELKHYTDRDGKLVERIVTKKGVVKEILRPAAEMRDSMARGLAEALEHSPGMSQRFAYADEKSIRAGILDVALRTRVGSAGSQGLKKYFVLMRKPLVGVPSDVIVYVKQEVPSAAERVGMIAKDSRDPGQRCANDMDELCRPRPVFNSWCRMGDESYWVTIREPWTNELDPEDINDLKTLEAAARIWSVASGATHRRPREVTAIRQRAGGMLSGELLELSDAYLGQLTLDLSALREDARVAEMVRTAEQRINSAQVPPAP